MKKRVKMKENKVKLNRLKLFALKMGYKGIYDFCSHLGFSYVWVWKIINGEKKASLRFLKKFKKLTGKDFFEIIEENEK